MAKARPPKAKKVEERIIEVLNRGNEISTDLKLETRIN